jgi:tRNA-dihydrouridine synthase 2
VGEGEGEGGLIAGGEEAERGMVDGGHTPRWTARSPQAPDASDLFRRSVCLAPMVRAGTLPLRLLAIDHGADLAWTEEIIASKLEACTRRETKPGDYDVVSVIGKRHNNQHPLVEYVGKGGQVVFQTSYREKGRCVLQIGAGGAAEAVRGAEVACLDAAAVDLNMGCSKHYAVAGP